jgi:hypothetical protein
MSIACEENFILAKNLPLDGTKPGSSLRSLEGLIGGRSWPPKNSVLRPATKRSVPRLDNTATFRS